MNSNPAGAAQFPYGSQVQPMDPQLVYASNSQFMQLMSVQNQGMYGSEAAVNRYPISPTPYSMMSPHSPYLYIPQSQQPMEGNHEMNNPYVSLQAHIPSMPSNASYMPPANPQ